MFRRALCCALTALALWTAPPSLPAAAPTATLKDALATAAPRATSTVYGVSYRKAGASAWTDYRTYRTSKEAQGAAKALFQKGFEVQVLARTTLTHVPERPKTGELPADRTVTASQARQVFNWMAAQRDIAFRYPIDGCYARAHLMIQRMQSKGLKPYKVWSFANGDPLHVKTPHVRGGVVEWKYHVAPALRVRGADGKQSWVVIDPSMFKAPVSLAAWRKAQTKPGSRYQPYVTVTALGVAPKDATGKRLMGTGYWPGPDPKEGADRHAAAKMVEYKRKEPRTVVAAAELEQPWVLAFARPVAQPADHRRRAA